MLAREEAVHDAREVARRLLVDWCIRLAPDAADTAVTGPMRLQQLGDHVLELAGGAPPWSEGGAAAKKLSGSGGGALDFIARTRSPCPRFPLASQRNKTFCGSDDE